MINPVLYLLVLALLFIILIFRFRHKTIFKTVLLYGAVGFVGAATYYILIVYVLQRYSDYQNITVQPLLYLFSLFIIMFMPFNRLNISESNILNSYKLIKIFKTICLASSLLSAILLVTDISKLSSYNMASFADVYENREIDTRNYIYYINQLKYYISYFLIPLFFYFLRLGSKYKLYVFCAAFSIMASLIHQFTEGGRGTIVNYVNYIVFFYIIYYKLLKSEIQKILKRVTIIISTVLVFSLSIITWSRYSTFETNEELIPGLASWVTLYVGEGPLAYSAYMWNSTVRTEGDNSFSFVKNLLGYNTFKDNFQRRTYWEAKQKIPNYIFYTVIGDVHSDIGPFFTALFFLFLALFVLHFIKKRNKKGWRLQDLVILQLYFEFVTMGVMCNCYKTYDSQWLIVCTIITCMILNLVESRNSSKLYAKSCHRNSSI